MKKRNELLVFSLLAIIVLVTFSSIVNADVSDDNKDDIEKQIKLITHCAEEYDKGTDNYVKLMLCLSNAREEFNLLLGATGREYGGLLNVKSIESALGEPIETTNWVWVENFGGGYEKKLEKPVPVWRDMIYDGHKISIHLEVHPNIIVNKFDKTTKEKPAEDETDEERTEEIRRKEAEFKRIFGDVDQKLVYRLNFWVQFKNPKDEIELDIPKKIEYIKELAIKYNEDSSKENAVELAKQSVSVEKIFNEYYRQNPTQCEELMDDIFGAENNRGKENRVSWDIVLHETDFCEFILRVEMCDDCQWHGIWVNGNYQCRGPNMQPNNEDFMKDLEDRNIIENYKRMDESALESETENIIRKIKDAAEKEDFSKAMQEMQRLNILTEGWNQKNDVWEQVNKEFEPRYEAYRNRPNPDNNYWWVKLEQEKRKRVKEIQDQMYEERKVFYQDLFSEYEKRESYYEQTMYEKRLLEDFVEKGEEICDNNVDDNTNNQIDCDDSQCGGKFCGNLVESVIGGDGQAITVETPLYCIAGTCQAKEEIVKEEIAVCGNHICEENETESCVEDCTQCAQHEAISCDGKVIFSGFSEDSCPLEPLCVQEKKSCEKNEDCEFLCGVGECVEGECKLSELTECQEAECTDGDKKFENCQSGEELVIALCINSLWTDTGLKCEVVSEPASEEEQEAAEEGQEVETEGEVEEEVQAETEEAFGNECVAKSDCGNENDVCSNGRCVTLPDIIKENEGVDIQEIISDIVQEQESNAPEDFESDDDTEEASDIWQGSEEDMEEVGEGSTDLTPTGNAIFNFFRSIGNFLFSRGTMTGFTTEGEVVEENTQETTETENADSGPVQEQEGVPREESPDNFVDEETRRREEEDRMREEREDEEDERRQEDRERRENECNERCSRECYDMRIRPCAEKCIFDECGEEFDCNVDEVTNTCETRCEEDTNIESCENSCQDKCMKGEQTWEEPKRDEHKEWKGAFSVGGSCRLVQGKEEANIWFNGWGQKGSPFENFEQEKHRFYQGNGADWCKRDLESLLMKRSAFQESFTQEFVEWFFGENIGNNADNWERQISSMYDLYWENVNTIREIVYRSQCLGVNEFPELDLINIKYESKTGGMIEFWEELQNAKFENIDKEINNVPTPYMKISMSPPRDFIEAELERSMENHEFPGPPEERTRGGKTVATPKGADRIIERFSKDGEKVHMAIQMNSDEDQVVFYMLVIIDEEQMYVEPMPPEDAIEKVGEPDIKVEFFFSKLFKLIERGGDMEDYRIEHPPWGKRPEIGTVKKVKQVVDGAQMYLEFRRFINSVEVTPRSASSEGKNLFKFILMKMMGDEGDEEPSPEEMEEFDEENLPEGWENPKVISGEVILEP